MAKEIIHSVTIPTIPGIEPEVLEPICKKLESKLEVDIFLRNIEWWTKFPRSPTAWNVAVGLPRRPVSQLLSIHYHDTEGVLRDWIDEQDADHFEFSGYSASKPLSKSQHFADRLYFGPTYYPRGWDKRTWMNHLGDPEADENKGQFPYPVTQLRRDAVIVKYVSGGLWPETYEVVKAIALGEWDLKDATEYLRSLPHMKWKPDLFKGVYGTI